MMHTRQFLPKMLWELRVSFTNDACAMHMKCAKVYVIKPAVFAHFFIFCLYESNQKSGCFATSGYLIALLIPYMIMIQYWIQFAAGFNCICTEALLQYCKDPILQRALGE